MASVSMSGNDTITINNTVLSPDLADGDCVDLTFPNDIAAGEDRQKRELYLRV